MNNLDWYTKVTIFCKAYQTCAECPYFLIHIQDTDTPHEGKRCFTSKQALEQLSSWLSESNQEEIDAYPSDEDADNQWLKDLLKGQFGDDEEDIDALYLTDDFI
ncbi:MAG: hypothetical protein PHR69_06710 [Sphaerochaeta sp.]|nr:hypothetical protein [Sphaerochaeta sp.]